jgi:hypothetical protein
MFWWDLPRSFKEGDDILEIAFRYFTFQIAFFWKDMLC